VEEQAEHPTPFHDEALIAALTGALVAVWDKLGLPLYQGSEEEAPRSAAAGGNTRVAVVPPAGGRHRHRVGSRHP
jgi:hypothetical protein